MPSARVKALQRKSNKRRFAEKMGMKSANEVAACLRIASDGFRFTPEWLELRGRAIARYGRVCLCCGREQSKGFPINIDHVKPRKLFPELALDIENLQPLCGPCNKSKGNSIIDYRR